MNGTLEAIRALQLATAHVVSVTVMVSGGLAWAFDVSSVNDLRSRIRGSVGAGKTKTAVEMEARFEEWLAKTEKEKEKEKVGNNDASLVPGQDTEAAGSTDSREAR